MTKLAIGAVAFACALACALIASFAVFEMVDKVNERLPAERQFALLGWYWLKYQRLAAEYKRLFPDGNLWRRYRVLTALMFVCGLIFAWGFGIFGR
jgi:hypothetical protein